MAGSSASAAVDLTDGEAPGPAAPVDLTGDDTDVDEEPAAAPASVAAPAPPAAAPERNVRQRLAVQPAAADHDYWTTLALRKRDQILVRVKRELHELKYHG